jgi:hypothetical protein
MRWHWQKAELQSSDSDRMMILLKRPCDFDETVAIGFDEELGGIGFDSGGAHTMEPCIAGITALAKGVDGDHGSGVGGAFTAEKAGQWHGRGGQE